MMYLVFLSVFSGFWLAHSIIKKEIRAAPGVLYQRKNPRLYRAGIAALAISFIGSSSIVVLVAVDKSVPRAEEEYHPKTMEELKAEAEERYQKAIEGAGG